MSERTTSDQEFVQLFSPNILERLHEDCLTGAVHIFRSPPGGGKTTILRAFTPNALRAFWHARPTQAESYRQLVTRGVLHQNDGPQLLGVLLSCAAGYADLPPGASVANAGMFRALLDCRVVLRTLKSLADLIGSSFTGELGGIKLDYEQGDLEFSSIPRGRTVAEMIDWAEQQEREVYSRLDDVMAEPGPTTPTHVRFESVLWLQKVRFVYNGRIVAPRRLLMIDDIQKLRRTQQVLLIDELVSLRPAIPIWLASRNIAFSDEFLAQGVREGRDVREYLLDELWGHTRNSQQFLTFAQNILDRRFERQTAVPGGSFAQYLADNLAAQELEDFYVQATTIFHDHMQRFRNNIRYSDWLARADQMPAMLNIDAITDLYIIRILVTRDVASRQLTLELGPLTNDELKERDSSSVKGAAEIFLHRELKVPYYFGIERLCALSTNNVEELLALAAALYEGMKAKQVLRRQTQPQLSSREQERRIQETAARKFDFIPRAHSMGTQAQRILGAIGTFCREKTFQATAPYAPGVTGVRLANSEIGKLSLPSKHSDQFHLILRNVLFECVAENLLTTRDSSASTSREAGTVFYLNRSLCAHFDLPLQYGGWQDVTVQRLVEWMEAGLQPSRNLGLEVS